MSGFTSGSTPIKADAIVSWDNVTITSDGITTAVLSSEQLLPAPRMLERQNPAASACYSLLVRKIIVNPLPVSPKTATLIIMKTGTTGTVTKSIYSEVILAAQILELRVPDLYGMVKFIRPLPTRFTKASASLSMDRSI